MTVCARLPLAPRVLKAQRGHGGAGDGAPVASALEGQVFELPIRGHRTEAVRDAQGGGQTKDTTKNETALTNMRANIARITGASGESLGIAMRWLIVAPERRGSARGLTEIAPYVVGRT